MKRCPWCDTPLPHDSHPQGEEFGVATLDCPHMAWTDRMIVRPARHRAPRRLCTDAQADAAEAAMADWPAHLKAV